MSLRARIALLVGLVLLAGLVAGLLLAGYESRRALDEELGAAMTGGRQTIASAFEDLPRSDHQERDLRQLVATFDGNRHVSATLIWPDGSIRARSQISRPSNPAPDWFVRMLAPTVAPAAIPTPAGVRSVATIELSPFPDRDAAAIWAEVVSIAMVLGLTFGGGLPVVYWAIGRALRPVSTLAAALTVIGRGDYSERVVIRGPAELVQLQLGFNAMARALQNSNARNRMLETQVRTIQDEERAELARDLHDEIGPHLFAVGVDAQMIAQMAARDATPNGRESIVERVGSIRVSVAHMQRLVREILGRLRPTEATELGLNAALDELASFWRSRQPEVTFEVILPGLEPDLPEPLKDTMYRVAQEAVANAVRHSEVAHIALRLETDREAATLQVVNDGTRRTPDAKHRGFGLIGMRERLGAWNGALIAGDAGPGWTITARVPLPPVNVGEAAG